MATQRICSIPCCGKKHAARGFCDPHFRRWKKSGDGFDRSPVLVVERGPICVIDDCGKPHSAHGYCANHYRSWQTYGDPLAVTKFKSRKSPRLEFLENALVSAADDCVLWPYSLDTHGYGQFHIKKKCYRAHRVVCELAYGPAPSPELQAAHSCGVRNCVNHRHLRWATPVENSADRIVHGTTIRGSKVKWAVLKESDIPAIWARRQSGESALKIARALGVKRSTIKNVLYGQTWAWVRPVVKPAPEAIQATA